MMMIVENIIQYFCMKSQVWWETNNQISCFCIDVMQNVYQMAYRSQTSTGLSVYVYGILQKMLTLFCLQNQFCNVPLTSKVK